MSCVLMRLLKRRSMALLVGRGQSASGGGKGTTGMEEVRPRAAVAMLLSVS
jgi:hypothetical protein